MIKQIDITGQLPEHFEEYYPRLIHFLQLYYKWLYRNGGFTEAQIDDLVLDANSIVTDVDRFLKEGRLRDFNTNSVEGNLPAVIEIATQPAAGTESEQLPSQYLMERTFDFFEAADEEVFETADGNQFDAPVRNDYIVESWFKKLGYTYVREQTDIGTLDRLLIVRLLKHIHNIKGTHQAMKIFFLMFFKEEVEVYLPKDNICIIDDNFIPDSLNVIRDDDFYQEFSYVIYVDGDPALYQDLFEGVYMKLVHPAGFKAFLRQKPVV